MGAVVVCAAVVAAPVTVGAVGAVGVAAATVPLTPGVATNSLVATFCSCGDIVEPVGKVGVATNDSIYSIGQVVKHAKFGMGTILNYEGSGDSMRLQIKFQKVGTKWLISSYANLEIV